MAERGQRCICVAAGWVLVLIILGAAGCTRPPLCRSGLTFDLQPLDCRSTQPREVVANLEQVAESQFPAGPAPTHQYCELTEAECEGFAAAFAPPANRRTVDVIIAADAAADSHGDGSHAAALQYDLLVLQQEQQRSLAAERALEAFFALLDAEQEAFQLQRSLQETQAMQDFVKEAESRGLALPIDTCLPARRRGQVLQRSAQVDLLRSQLNDRLRLLLGWDLGIEARVWPIADLNVTPTAVNVEAAVSAGLANRRDLLELRLLLSGLNEHTLPLVRAVLALADGTPMTMPTGLKDLKSQRDLYLREEQLEHLLAERERSAAAEIREAVSTLETRLRQVRLAQESVRVGQDHVAELQRQQRAGRVTELDISLARLEAVAADGNLFHAVVAWKLALVKLNAAQGLLAANPLSVPAEDESPCQPEAPTASVPPKEPQSVSPESPAIRVSDEPAATPQP